MTLYVLPDGTQVEQDQDPGLVRGAGVWVIHPVYGSIAVERGKLTEVPPSLPQEPPIGEIVVVKGDIPVRVFIRWDNGWWEIGDTSGGVFGWESLCALTMAREGRYPVRYVPDPSDDAPELPREELIAEVAQAMRDANMPGAWDDGFAQVIPMGHFARVAVDHILAAREARLIQHNTQEG